MNPYCRCHGSGVRLPSGRFRHLRVADSSSLTWRSRSMHASASGPLGALLMIAPLAAIPVFAIVGVPQFAPVVASLADNDDDLSNLGDPAAPVSTDPVSTVPVSKIPVSTRGDEPRDAGKTTDDLFAPVLES